MSHELTILYRKNFFLSMVTLVILGGLVFSVGFHFVYFPAIGQTSYPYSTFLGLESLRFSDFYDTCDRSLINNPYRTWTLYFPATFLFFRPLCSLTKMNIGYLKLLFIFFSAFNFSLFFIISIKLLNLKKWNIFKWAIISACCYPMLYAWNRGNIEPLTLSLVASSYYLSYKKLYRCSGVALAMTSAMKGTPGVFGSRYFLQGNHRSFLFMILSVFTFTFLGLVIIGGDPVEQLNGLIAQHIVFESVWADGLDGLVRSTSLYGMYKIPLLILDFNIKNANSIAMFFWALTLVIFLGISIFIIRTIKPQSTAFVFLSSAIFFLFLPKVTNDYKTIILLLFPVLLSEKEWAFFGALNSFLFGIIFIPKNFIILNFESLHRYDANLHQSYSDITIGAILTPLVIIFLFVRFSYFIKQSEKQYVRFRKQTI